MTPKIKICGITTLADAQLSLDAGAHFLGFILAPRSPRCIPPEELAPLIAQLPPEVPKVGVFAGIPPDQVVRIVRQTRLTIAQLHETDPAFVIGQLGADNVWPVISLDTPEQAEAAARHPAPLLVVDTAVQEQTGGTGRTGNWPLARQVAAQRPIILAGGLHPGNVHQAVEQVRPYALDVSSGVEERPRIKSAQKIRAFIQNARD